MYLNEIVNKCPKCFEEKELAILNFQEIKAMMCLSCMKTYVNKLNEENNISFTSEECPICNNKKKTTYFKYKNFKSNICTKCLEKYICEITKED